MSAFAIAFVRAVTSRASWTNGSRSRSGTSPSGNSVNSAMIGSARKAMTMPASRAERAAAPALPAVPLLTGRPPDQPRGGRPNP